MHVNFSEACELSVNSHHLSVSESYLLNLIRIFRNLLSVLIRVELLDDKYLVREIFKGEV